MKTTRKVILSVLCVALIVVASVMGTLAFLTDEADVTNTFTVGKVGLELDEVKVDEYGKPIKGDDAGRTTEGNKYKLIPGHTYTKDPTVTVDAKSEESYIRMIVTITDYADVEAVLGPNFLPQNFVAGWDSAIWVSTKEVKVENDTATYEFRYHKTVNTLNNQTLKLEPLFTSFTMPEGVINANLDKLEGMKILVEAHAIQADGFANADAAWAAFTK